MADSTSRKVIEYVSNIAPALRGIQTLEALNKKLISSFGKDAPRAVQDLGRSIDKIKTKNIIDEKGIAKSIPVIDQVGRSFQTADGKAMTFTQTSKLLKDGTVSTTNSLGKMDKNTVSLGQNMARLAKRALLTIPIWFALRTVMSSVSKTITEGIKTIADQDRALQKAKRNIQGTTSVVSANFKTLATESRKLSLQTGETVETVVNAFQKFATVGFDFKTSMAGANGAVKLAVLLFGDAEETANAFARSMRVLVDTSAGAKDAGTQIAEAMAQTAELWKTNAFEIDEFTQSLEKFSPTAKVMNLTTQQTIALLSSLGTAGLRGRRAGTLLRTSFTKIISQTDKLATSLGVRVNPELDTTFDVFMKTLNAMEMTRDSAGKVSPAFERVVKSIVGLRSADAIKGLIALRKELIKNLSVVPDLRNFNQEFEKVNSQIFALEKQMHNANREIGRALVTGIVGGEDFRDSLEDIVNALRTIQKGAEKTGISLKNLFDPRAIFGFKGVGGIIRDLIAKNIKEGFEKSKDSANLLVNDINNALRYKLDKTALTELLTDFRAKLKLNNIQISDSAIAQLEGTIRKQLQEGFEKPITIDEKIFEFESDQAISKKIIQSLQHEFQSRGALESQALQMVDALSSQFKIQETTLDVLDRQLNIERALSEEKRLQSRLGSDSIKLFRIAQEQGIEVARKIGEVLSGNTSFDLFVQQGGQALDIFKKQFSDIFEQQQALSFFRGDVVPGAKGLAGGTRIPIAEEAIRQQVSPFNVEALLKKSQALSAFERITKTQITQANTISNTFNLSGKFDEKEVMDVIIKSYDNPQVQKKFANLAFGDNQTNNL